jgi:hypothetical protein
MHAMKKKLNVSKMAKDVTDSIVAIIDDCDHLHESLADIFEDYVTDDLTDEQDKDLREAIHPFCGKEFEKFILDYVTTKLTEYKNKYNV